MKSAVPFSRFTLASDGAKPENELAPRRTDIQWGSPIFRAPSLPTPQQINNELPFTVNFRGKQPRRT